MYILFTYNINGKLKGKANATFVHYHNNSDKRVNVT